MEDKKYTAMDIANLIIVYANQYKHRTEPLTPIKLQKILYYVYVECLKKHSIKLFDTPIEKWKFGPVVSSVYHSFKSYGANHIEVPESTLVFNEADLMLDEVEFSIESLQLDENLANLIQSKVENLINENPFTLVELTHNEEPWKKFEKQIMEGKMGLTYSDQEILAM